MVVLLDANVILNYLTNREDPETQSSVRIVKLCADGKLKGYMAFHSLSVIWYVLRKGYTETERRNLLKSICKILTVVSTDQSSIIRAIENDSFSDFEDCLQDTCATGIDADYIITCNEKDFAMAKTTAILPSEFINRHAEAR